VSTGVIRCKISGRCTDSIARVPYAADDGDAGRAGVAKAGDGIWADAADGDDWEARGSGDGAHKWQAAAGAGV
jgi:hypothetical protein